MRWSLSRLRPLHIALLSVTYWLGLTVVKLGWAIFAAWRVSRLPPGHGSISAGLDNTVLHLTIAKDGATLWAGSASVVTLFAWVVGPPLLLALTWRWTRGVEVAGGPDAEGEVSELGDAPAQALPAPPPPWQMVRGPQSDTTRAVDVRRPDAVSPSTPPEGAR